VTKTLKISLISLITAPSFSGLFVTGDYFGIFGLKKYLVLGFIESSFKPVDEATGAPVLDVKIRCFQKGNDNACTQKESRITGLVIARIPVQKLVWKSLLFNNKEELIPTNDPQIHIKFISNYINLVETFIVEDLYNNPVRKYPVKMKKNS